MFHQQNSLLAIIFCFKHKDVTLLLDDHCLPTIIAYLKECRYYNKNMSQMIPHDYHYNIMSFCIIYFIFDCAVLYMHPQTTVRPTSCQQQTLKVCVCVRLCAHVCERHSGRDFLFFFTVDFLFLGTDLSPLDL